MIPNILILALMKYSLTYILNMCTGLYQIDSKTDDVVSVELEPVRVSPPGSAGKKASQSSTNVVEICVCEHGA